MSDFFEIDFLDVEAAKSGDAISLRYRVGDELYIHVVDGGFQDTGDKLIQHIARYYDAPRYIDHVVATHPDGDHTAGLRAVLEHFQVGALWMLRPWLYAAEIIYRFSRFTSVENLQIRLREIYPHLAALEDIANEKQIAISEPLQGATVGAFVVLAPSRKSYLDLIVQSERTPESSEKQLHPTRESLAYIVERAAAKAVFLIKAAWGVEVFSPDETSAENEMSVVQYSELCGQRILLTGDAGRKALSEAADRAPFVGLTLPGIARFQAPHHGSRRNISTEVLDRWLGPQLPTRLEADNEAFTAIISSAKEDEDHPRKAVIRALIHRGARVVATEGQSLRTSHNAPDREGWVAAIPLDYPQDQEA